MSRYRPAPGEDGEHVTFCRLCEAHCGLIAMVRAGRVVRIGPDRAHPISKGHLCVKGPAIADVAYDPDRITQPLRRTGAPGQFEPVSWDEALDDIAARLARLRTAKGPDSIGAYLGNPISFSTTGLLGSIEFLAALGTTRKYGASSQDSNSRMAANYFLFGSSMRQAFPDLTACDFLIVMGANPLVSQCSMINAPRIRHDIDAVHKRGGVVVVDPRHTETAQAYEHLPIRAGTDAWLLGAMLRVVFTQGLADRRFLDENTASAAELERAVEPFTLDAASKRTGIAAKDIEILAKRFAATERAAIYGRVGLCRSKYATLTNVFLTALSVVTGKFGKPGTTVFGIDILKAPKETGPSGYGEVKSAIGEFPAVAGFLPAVTLPDEILDEGQLKALLLIAGNPVLSISGDERLKTALQALELLVSIDFYVNESNRYAHYILPGTTFLERADVPFLAAMYMLRPFFQYTDAVVPPIGEAREEFEIFFELARRMGLGAPTPSKLRRRLGRLGVKINPLTMVDLALRLGPAGDLFGLRRGLSLKRLKREPHGIMPELSLPYDRWRESILYPEHRIHLWAPELGRELQKLLREPEDNGLRLIGRRDIRSLNSWMHNIPGLTRSQEPVLFMHGDDAAACGVDDGALAHVARRDQPARRVLARVKITDQMIRGSVCYPHGWGHAGSWTAANATDGTNINLLVGTGADDVEALSSTTIMDALPVRVVRADEAVREA